MAYRQPPVTPEKQMISKRHTDPEFKALEDADCSSTTKNKLISLKRKASETLDRGSPTNTTSFLKWRLAVVENELHIRDAQKQALVESNNVDESLMNVLKSDEKALRAEKSILLSERKILEGDLNDIVMSKDQLTQAYITELRLSLDAASKSKDKLSALKSPKMDRRLFQETVNHYLGTKFTEQTGEISRWCNVLGFWLTKDLVKCAHIVPYSWDTKHMAHMFGSDEPPLQSRRNGLSLQNKIEEAFDNCWIVIVPADSVETTPTKWKLVLLNTSIKDKDFYTDTHLLTSRPSWKWRDIDGRQLSFPNDNRPARRFLYMRYALAWLHAEDKAWPGFKKKVPPGEVWASPNKPDGYLRRSILLDLGKSTGDRLPQDLINAGVFEDPDTSSLVHDEVAAIKVVEHVQDHLDGMRDAKPNEDDTDESEEDT